MIQPTNDARQTWILCGYERFAREGTAGLKIEVMAKAVFKSKSSFYHHFADTEVFTEWLLQYHLERAQLMAERELACQNIVPELLHVILEFKQDLLFNRQLRVHRDVPAFKTCFEKANAFVGGAIVQLWANELGLRDQSHLAGLVLNLSMENFFLQITEDTLTYEWLSQYVFDLKKMVAAFQQQQIVR